MENRPVPVYILSGFLGSGKTTLLSRAVRHYQEKGMKPAVVMNELGEVNLDGLAVGVEVPMAEMLDGCICCTVRGDLGITIQQLIHDEAPDVVFIEATGVANPMEILDGVTEASLYMKVELRGVITVTDAGLLSEQISKGAGKTYRLLEEQIRCAGIILLNKADLVNGGELDRLKTQLAAWNPYARLIVTERADADMAIFDETIGHARAEPGEDCGCSALDHHGESRCTDPSHRHNEARAHHSHEHVMVFTHYMNGPVDSEAFEEWIGRLPESVYRGKGVLTFRDTASRYLFQFAYRQADFMKITPQGNIPDVVVFIGEHLPKAELAAGIAALEHAKEGGRGKSYTREELR